MSEEEPLQVEDPTLQTRSARIHEAFSLSGDTRSIDTTGHAIRVTVIRGGKSINGYFYDESALRTIARMIEGAQAYCDHAMQSTARSVRDMVGFYQDACYVAPDASGKEAYGRVDATLHILESVGWLWSLIREAFELKKPDLIGLSIDIMGQWQVHEASGTRAITRVHALHSCDIVTRPSAGGSFNRIIHGELPGGEEISMEKEQQTPNENYDDRHSAANQERLDAYSNWLAQQPETPDVPAVLAEARKITEQQMESRSPKEQQRREIQENLHELDMLLGDIKMERSQLLLMRRLRESVLPQAVCDQIFSRFERRIFEERELDQEIERSKKMMAELTSTGLVRGHTYEKATISMQITEAEKMQAAFDDMLGVDIDKAHFGNIRGFTSIREAYARVTGDSSLSAGISAASQLGAIHISEDAPLQRIREADTTTASFSYLLGTSMNKRLLHDYQAWPAEWMNFVSIVPVRDFKQQTRVRMGAFGSLPIVAEDSAYSAVTLADSAATYVPQKRGNLVTVSRETILNDDLQAIKQIPTKLAVAAAYTLAEFVYSFLANNPGIYDGSNLFTTGAPHNNLGSAALSSAAMQTGITAMREQTNYAGKRIGLRPRFLIVPPELEWTSMIVTKSAGVPGSNNNDINPMLGYLTPVVSPQLTNANQWFMATDPREVDTIEIGFVGGQVNPALFIQDQPLFGLNFTQDAITYKVRHEYGGCVVDYRGLYRGI